MALPVVRSSQTPADWDPFRELNELHAQMHRWMDSVFDRTLAVGADHSTWSPLADLSETEDAYVVEVELPGVTRDDVTVDLSGAELVIEGERKEREREGWFRHRTRSVGRFRYAVTLPQGIDPEGVEATLSKGVLTVRVPKSRALKPRRIAITER
ncbi:Hsp20/alpha crystallin family protein [Thermobifida cellulosilytica]|uniref:Heat-shock protein Hsp20 n=1 Tax=Thermobifida cellulosilytica TB100 TaxID=665004 RepID=A0A147KE33_THECS|nr:Hsp20/alpha crystallin family protein [Thermobifida cellulosilytica]KUP95566.1 heat-shock protein Hsp20 [Thermobifida cellulosilytica TB100]